MAERFTATKNIDIVGMDSGAQNLSRTVSQELSRFQEKGQVFLNKKAVERGKKRAGEKILKKDPITGTTLAPEKETGFLGSIEKEAYNIDLANRYIAEIDLDLTAQINQIASENPTDVISFNERAKKVHEGFMKSIDPEIKGIIDFDIRRTISNNAGIIQKNAYKLNKELNGASLAKAFSVNGTDAINAVRSGEINMASDFAMKAMVNLSQELSGGHITSDVFNEKKVKFENEFYEQERKGTYEIMVDEFGVDHSMEELERERKKIPKGMSPDVHDKMMNEVRTSINKRGKYKDDLQKDREKEIWNTAIIDLSNGDIGYFDALNLPIKDPTLKGSLLTFAKGWTKEERAYKASEEVGLLRREQINKIEKDKMLSGLSQEVEAHFRFLDERGELTYEEINVLSSITEKGLAKKYTKILDERNKIAKEREKDVQRASAEVELLTKSGTQSADEILSYSVANDVDPQAIPSIVERNEKAKGDSSRFRGTSGYKNVITSLKKDIGDLLFIKGKDGADYADIQENRVLGMEVIAEFDTFCEDTYEKTKEYPDFTKWYEDKIKPLAEDASKNKVLRWMEGWFGNKEQTARELLDMNKPINVAPIKKTEPITEDKLELGKFYKGQDGSTKKYIGNGEFE
jgi:hypothetical protein